jgi:DNA-binding NarL/FixJ family response regulator
MTKVLVADDFPLVRDGFAVALRRDPDITVVGFAEDGVHALEQARALAPDVVLLDLRMPRMSGLMVLGQLAQELPGVRVLVVTDEMSDPSAVHAVAAGAAGLVSKSVTGEELCAAVHTVARGEAAMSPDLLCDLMSGVRQALDGKTPSATPRSLSVSELEVLRLVAKGRTDIQISESLFISARTVQSHLSRIRAKVGVTRRAQLARWATEHAVT